MFQIATASQQKEPMDQQQYQQQPHVNNDEDTCNLSSDEEDFDDPTEMLDYNNADFDFENDEDDAENDTDENNIYHSDPEYFDYECFQLEKIDWIMEIKCQRIMQHMQLDNPFDALCLLKQFRWNAKLIIDAYEQDPQIFMQTHFNDNNNNKGISGNDKNLSRSKLLSYINIFNNESKLFADLIEQEKQTNAQESNKLFNKYCDICCVNNLNIELGMAAAISECEHYFCRECWRMHFESLINESFTNTFVATSQAFECMQTKCKQVASKQFVLDCLKYTINNNEDSFCSVAAIQQEQKEKQMNAMCSANAVTPDVVVDNQTPMWK
jgi:hypothetical protein